MQRARRRLRIDEGYRILPPTPNQNTPSERHSSRKNGSGHGSVNRGRAGAYDHLGSASNIPQCQRHVRFTPIVLHASGIYKAQMQNPA